DFDLMPGDRNWARWISIWRREIEIGRDGFRSGAGRSKLGAMDFDLVPGDRNWARWISIWRREIEIGRDGFRSGARRSKLGSYNFENTASSWISSEKKPIPTFFPDPDSLSFATVPECLENGVQVTARQQLARSALRVPVPSSPAFAHRYTIGTQTMP